MVQARTNEYEPPSLAPEALYELKVYANGNAIAAARFMSMRHETLIPTDWTISARRAVSLSIRARNCAGEAWDA